MRILDRYPARQLIPVWIWCIAVFVFLSCLIDVFERLDEILRYRVPLETVVQYYANFLPLVFIRAAPLGLLFASAFVATRLVRYQEFLAMNASGTSLARASVPFVFVGWVVGLVVFVVNEQVVPRTSVVYERLRQETFERQADDQPLERIVHLDAMNRLYHARAFDPARQELSDLTVLEHDAQNYPKRTINARRAIFTPHGWLLLYGTMSRVNPQGMLEGNPEPFLERLMEFPITPETLRQPERHLQALSYGQLRNVILRLKQIGITNVRRYTVELISKITLPLMCVLMGLIGFVGSVRQRHRGPLRGLGVSLLWGAGYYILAAAGQGVGTEGLLPVPLAVWTPHLIALAVCSRALLRST